MYVKGTQPEVTNCFSKIKMFDAEKTEFQNSKFNFSKIKYFEFESTEFKCVECEKSEIESL